MPGSFFFFFNDTATTEIYTLSLHDALPISTRKNVRVAPATVFKASSSVAFRRSTLTGVSRNAASKIRLMLASRDRKSTRLNSSHLGISYAVFCLKKKKRHKPSTQYRAAPHK